MKTFSFRNWALVLLLAAFAVAVRAVERVGEVGEHAPAFGAREPPLQAQALGERLAAHVAHDEVPDPADLAEGVERENARVREPRDGARLPAEALDELVVLVVVLVEDFQRDIALEQRVARAVHARHPAGAE